MLAGDGLLTLAFETALRANNNIKSDNKVKAVNMLAHFAGIDGMVGGQVLDLQAENTKPTLEKLQTIDRLKTGALIRAASLLGCYASNTENEKYFKAAEEYSADIGLAFQIVDDILDVTSDSETLGKPVGSDEKNEKITYVSLMGIDKSRDTVKELTENAVQALDVFEADTKFLKNLAISLADRKN